uniref:Putative Efflux transporter, RND family, MFP subunit n=1 Tax=Magnetococcus massalia (strain MO-1) TaxID=451514 RepID=A0A1S7LCJ9_MAGMO|nr:putative Efflux transporter, RND family, MFP subunit [Candidatus Magnetococcus massalia]
MSLAHHRRATSLWFFFLVLPLLLIGCGEKEKKQSAGKKRTPRVHLVQTIAATEQPLQHQTLRTGTLTAQKQVRIYNQEEGHIAALTLNEGDRVKQGSLLVRLDDRLLKSQLAKTRAARDKAEADLKRIQTLSKRKIVTHEKLTSSQTALRVAEAEEAVMRTRMGYTTIRAPLSGVVTERRVDPGDVAPRHTHLLTLIDPSTLITQVEVSELLLPHLKQGDPAQIRIDALGKQRFAGRIQRIHPTVDPRTRQGVVEVALTPPPPGVMAGQLCRVSLKTAPIQRLMIPFASLRQAEHTPFVYLLVDGKAVQRPVSPGMRMGDQVAILEGLKAGDKVITRGFLGLTPGKKVTPAPEAQQP